MTTLTEISKASQKTAQELGALPRLRRNNVKNLVQETLAEPPLSCTQIEIFRRVFGYRIAKGNVLHWSILEKHYIENGQVKEATDLLKFVVLEAEKIGISVKSETRTIKRHTEPVGSITRDFQDILQQDFRFLKQKTEWHEWVIYNQKIQKYLENWSWKTWKTFSVELACRKNEPSWEEPPFKSILGNAQAGISRAIKSLVKDQIVCESSGLPKRYFRYDLVRNPISLGSPALKK